MSQDDPEVIRRWLDAWNSADLDTFADLFDGDVEVMTDPSWMEAGPFNGRAAVGSWYEGLKESREGHDEKNVEAGGRMRP